MLQVLAKRPADRYSVALEMAFAFRSALVNSGIRLDAIQTWAGLLNASTSARMAVPRGQFEPLKQTAAVPRVTAEDLAQRTMGGGKGNSLLMPTTQRQPTVSKQQLAAQNDGTRPGGGLLSRTGMMPSVTQNPMQEARQTGNGLLSKTGQFPMVGTGVMPSINQGTGLLSRTGQFPMVGTGAIPQVNRNETATPTETGNRLLSSTWTKEPPTTAPRLNSSRLETAARQTQAPNTVKLNDPVKVVKVPVAGQPGQFVTGLLPFTQQEEESGGKKKKSKKLWLKIGLIAALIIIVLGSAGAFLFLRSHTNGQITSPTDPTKQSTTQQGTTQQTINNPTDPKVKAQIQATATAQANVILSDPLDKNIHNWLTSPPNVYAFKNGAYHITDHGDTGAAVALPARTFDDPLAYTLTLQEINGDDTNTKNSFGMIFRFNQATKGGQTVTSFYSFEVVNIKGGEYQFWRYDDSNKNNAWTRINNETMPIGNEFHQGKATNTIKIFMQGNKFTITVNGKALAKTFQDDALKAGTVGMIVNNDGTEVAFSNLLLTRS